MKKLKKNQLKLDKEVISSLSENELLIVKGGVNTEPLTRCRADNTTCLMPAPSKGVCFSEDKRVCGIVSEPCLNSGQQCIVKTSDIILKVCVPSVHICKLTDKC